MFKKLTITLVFFSVLGLIFVGKEPLNYISAIISQYIVQATQPDVPVLLNIPAIGVSVNIELVGLDEENRMAAPKDINQVGWYKYGFKPGENGNAVMAGHVDSETAPAIFSKLSELKIGDEVIVKDARNKRFKFRVFKQEIYDYDKVPLESIFGAANRPYLNLITCTGIFERGTKNYLKRLVIYTQMEYSM